MKKADQFSAILRDLRDLQSLQTRVLVPLAKKIGRLENTVERLALAVNENRAAVAADDDDWRRIPSHPARCAISGWSRSGLWNHVKAGRVRSRIVKGARFYAGADVRRMISEKSKS